MRPYISDDSINFDLHNADITLTNTESHEADKENDFDLQDTDSYRQIRIIVRCLSSLGHLQDAFEVITCLILYLKERISIDLYHVVDRNIQDMKQE